MSTVRMRAAGSGRRPAGPTSGESPGRARAPRRFRACLALPVLAALPLAACAGADDPRSALFPSDFQPGPPLGDPPAPDPRATGSDYLGQVGPRFARPWRAFLDDLRFRLPPDHELNRATLSVRLRLELDAEGELVALRVTAPSGQAAFDQAAREVAGEAVPLPKPPADLLSDDQRLHLEWLFARDFRQAGPATASIELVEWPLDRAVPELIARVPDAARRVGAAAERAAAAEHRSTAAEAAIAARFREVCAAAIGQALASDDSARQAAGVAAAAAIRLATAAPALRRLARGSADPAVRRAALRALGQLGDRAAIPLLRRVADGEGEQGAELSAAAAAALVDLGQGAQVRASATARLRAPTDVDRWTALAIMTQVAIPEAAPDLIALLRGRGEEERVERITAAAALGVIAAGTGDQTPAVAALVDCLTTPDGAQRAACAEAIAGATAAGAALPAYARMRALLRDRDETVRAAATLAAARLDPARFAAALGTFAKERSELVLTALATGLSTVPGPRAVARLGKLAASDSPAVRQAAAASLAARADPAARTLLARLTSHRDPVVRAAAIRAERRTDALRPALRDDAPQVAAAALAALVAVEGAESALPDAADLLASLPAGSADRTLVARAWLGP